MPSSTSSSDRIPADLPWQRILLLAASAALCFVIAMEGVLAAKGFGASIADSTLLWVQARTRASAAGNRALILLGDSRMQLDMDLEQLRKQTGLWPVQLAIDGSSYIPVLDELAADPSITGTVLVSYKDQLLAPALRPDDAADVYVAMVEQVRRHPGQWWGRLFELRLAAWFESSLRSYADGARPIDSLRTRVLATDPVSQYLRMQQDRSRMADYRLVTMPEFYYARVLRNLGEDIARPPGASDAEYDRAIAERIDQLGPRSVAALPDNIAHVRDAVRRIQSRGGRVIFTMLPTSGLVRAADRRRYPRALFWDRFAAAVGAPTLHFEDAASLRGFTCPDGSHLDQRDRARFTQRLVTELHLDDNGAPR